MKNHSFWKEEKHSEKRERKGERRLAREEPRKRKKNKQRNSSCYNSVQIHEHMIGTCDIYLIKEVILCGTLHNIALYILTHNHCFTFCVC